VKKDCIACNGTGWDDENKCFCEECGGSGEVECQCDNIGYYRVKDFKYGENFKGKLEITYCEDCGDVKSIEIN